jgi:hypothetical protein
LNLGLPVTVTVYGDVRPVAGRQVSAFALPRWPRNELSVRLHHRCDVLGLLNDYGSNGENFLVVGYRRRF